MTLRAITVRQPWAGLIVAGIKRFENRGAAVSWRGELAIHAGKRVDAGELARAVGAGHLAPMTALGSILAVAELTDCHLADTTDPTGCCG
ncbi:ASCH domain-containing protein, partial [Paractinoplanes ferrugineus]